MERRRAHASEKGATIRNPGGGIGVKAGCSPHRWAIFPRNGPTIRFFGPTSQAAFAGRLVWKIEASRSGRVREGQAVVRHIDEHGTAVFEPSEEDLVGQDVADLLLDDAGKRARAEDVVVTGLPKPGASGRHQRDRDVAVRKLALELQNELVDDRFHRFRSERLERDDGVQAVAELWIEHAFDRRLRPPRCGASSSDIVAGAAAG